MCSPQLNSPLFVRINRAQRNDQNNDVSVGVGRNWEGREKLEGGRICIDGLQGAAKEKATDIFNHLDVNGDGRVELGEFVHGSLKDKELVSMLKRKEVVKVTKEKPPDVCVVLVEDTTVD